MTLPLIAASVLLLLQTAKGSIEGTVVNSVTSKPIPGAQVTANRLSSISQQTPAGSTITSGTIGGVLTINAAGGVVTRQEGNAIVPIPPAVTDSNGHFAFPDLESGTYLLRAAADGYARQENSTRPGSQTGMTAQITLSAGQLAKDTVFHLTPGGTVSGRVTGSSGQALVNMEVSLLRSVYDQDGRKSLQQSGAAQTDDRGEYRIFWAPPGRYYLSVAASNRPIPGAPFNPASVTNKYPRTFYPSSPDPATGTTINVQPAAELNGMDFRLTEQPTYRVRGRLVDSTTGQIPARGVSISISPREMIVNSGAFSSGNPYNPADGTFELRDVPSGSYFVRAQLPFNGRPESGQPFPTPTTATAPVDVAGGDVDGIVLNFVPPISISGRLRIEGDPSTSNVSRVNFFIRPAMPGVAGVPPRPPQWNADGTFKIDGVAPGEYVVNVNGVAGQPNMYVKEMRFGSTDILAHPLTIAGAVADEIIIVLAKDAGQITGIVRGDSQQLLQGIQVVLIPDRRDRHDLYRTILTDSTGHFTFRAMPPGSYKVFAWEDIERNSWFDTAVLTEYEDRGRPATVDGSADLNLELRAIPTRVR